MKIGIRTPSLKKSFKARTTGRLKRAVKSTYNPVYGAKGAGIVNNPKKAIYNKVYEKVTVDSLENLKDASSKNNNNIKENSSLIKEKELEEQIIKTHNQFQKLEELKKKYKDTLNQYEYITNELWSKNTYHMVNSQPSIFNKYADRYIELCNMYLQILPDYLKFEKESDIIFDRTLDNNHTPNDIVNMLRLLEKQEKYNEIINVSKYLLSLGLTEDGTKKGVKGRIEKAILKFNQKFNTNYTYQADNDLIIDLNTGEIME